MTAKQGRKDTRRENRVAVYFPPELLAALDGERKKRTIPESESTFIVNALAEWADKKGLPWRSKR